MTNELNVKIRKTTFQLQGNNMLIKLLLRQGKGTEKKMLNKYNTNQL